MKGTLLLVLILILSAFKINAQINFCMIEEENLSAKKWSKANTMSDVQKILNQKTSENRNKGYITAGVDSSISTKDSLVVFYSKGKQYQWASIKKGNIDEEALTISGYRPTLFNEKPVRASRISALFNRLLLYYINNGYPFAELGFKNISDSSGYLKASLHVEKNYKVVIDSVAIKGNAKLSETFLYSFLGVKPGDNYNESIITKIDSRLNELPFVRISKPTQIFIIEKVAVIRIHIDERKASQFNGIVGFLPNNQQTGRLLLTGEATLKLKNALNRAETIDAEWRRLQAQTQNLNLHFGIPFLFKTPFGFDSRFDLYKRDTTFLTVHLNAGVNYAIQGYDFLKVFAENRIGRLLSTKPYENTALVPPNLDVSTVFYGIEYNTERLDYRFNPRKGWTLNVKGSAGRRRININPRLNPSLYDSLALRSLQYALAWKHELYIPIKGALVFKLSNFGKALLGNNLFQSELYRIGGINTIRGFDEESIFASFYHIVNAEMRYLLEQNSFFFLFFNKAYYEQSITNRMLLDRPFGIGSGISFETKTGIFSISYALGSQFGNPIEFRASKIHFGLTSLF